MEEDMTSRASRAPRGTAASQSLTSEPSAVERLTVYAKALNSQTTMLNAMMLAYDVPSFTEALQLLTADLTGTLAELARVSAERNEAHRALAVCRQTIDEQTQARADPSMPRLSPAMLKRLKGEAEACYALAEGRDDRIYSHALDMLATWQERAKP